MTTEYLYLNSRDELLRIDISKIVYFESDGNYTNIVLANKLKGVVTMNLSQMQKVLSDRLKERATIFARVGKRYIINLNHIFLINPLQQKLVLSDGDRFAFQIGISKDALKSLKDMYVNSAQKKSKE